MQTCVSVSVFPTAPAVGDPTAAGPAPSGPVSGPSASGPVDSGLLVPLSLSHELVWLEKESIKETYT